MQEPVISPRNQPIVIGHYTGQAGRRYFRYQSRFGNVTAKIIAKKFKKHIRPSDVVLDFGCGGGFVLPALSCRQRLGVEINPIARKTAEQNGLTCFETLDQVQGSSVDVVICHHSLEHVPSPLGVLRDLQAKLKPGGLLLAVVPIDDWRAQKQYDPTDINHHLYTWTPLLLGHLLAEAGFDTTTLSTRIGVNGWFRGYQKWYGQVPDSWFELFNYAWCVLRRTREIYGIVRTPICGTAPERSTIECCL